MARPRGVEPPTFWFVRNRPFLESYFSSVFESLEKSHTPGNRHIFPIENCTRTLRDSDRSQR